MKNADPRISEHYDELAEYWAEVVNTPERRELLWATLEAMLAPVDGRRVLDAGCGSGVFSEALATNGAEVVGVDVSEQMVQQARERVPDATFVQGDLGEPLVFLDDDSVDAVLCQHVFSHLETLTTPLDEFARVLRDGGTLVVSTHNPVHDYLVVRDGAYPTEDEQTPESAVETADSEPSYADTERYDVHWGSGDEVNRGTYYRRSIEGILTPLLDAGFTLESVVEPVPDDAFRRDHPAAAEKYKNGLAHSICLCLTA
ncbi:Methyltransferase domain-containing protein [Halogranum gelatinilyticum]|uniref:Methyltransferase domain-containing protein n=1 Tax=Halogranum gelatinilyticum TaxID=660521 RepID=A0A1G9WIP4_9EURY|nr:class I SAM-dependent methyltransferase [Halogranum gelatinilyticum]SDM84340.1 Methyltransferase domain-containing protein [Halogranum gelatinilyticum]